MSERQFDPMNKPEQCSHCNDFPDWLEIYADVFQCQNCYTTFNIYGRVIEEGEPKDESKEDLWDE